MSPEAIIELILKILPSAISIVQNLVGNDTSITSEHVPQILSTMADISKGSTDVPDLANHINVAEPMAHDSHSP